MKMKGRRYWPLLALPVFAACEPPPEQVEIGFAARYEGEGIACAGGPGGLSLSDLRFLVHDLRLRAADGRETPVALTPDSRWQSAEVAMLDLEDGSERCANGSEERNAILRGTVPRGVYEGLVFRLGVPAHLNHANPLLAAAPLSDPAMHWHWLTGYKFLRAGVAGSDDGFWMHLGSARCEGTASDMGGCRSPNRPELEVAGFVPGQHVVVVELAELFAAVDLADGVPTDCSSGPAEIACAGPFRALGLDHATGSAARTRGVFYAERPR